MILEGVRLMLVGMVTVFGFLSLLVGLMAASASFFGAFGDRFADPEPSPRAAGAGAQSEREDEIAVVLAAIEAQRRN